MIFLTLLKTLHYFEIICVNYVGTDIAIKTHCKFAILYLSDKLNGKENLMAKTNYNAMAKEIYNWCVAHEAWDDACIYFNGKAWATWSDWHGVQGKKIAEGLYEYEDKNPCDYFEFGNPNTLSMSFEGTMYSIMNYYWEYDFMVKWFDEFHELFDKYNGYIEMGHAWNFTFVED